jgi:hypothetical protein
MLDIDPGLDTKLRAFFDHIEASAPPSALTDIAETTPVRGRRTLNLFAGIAAATVIAASVALFAVELRGHEGAPSPAGTSAPAKPSASVSPSATALKSMPLLGAGGVPGAAHVVIPVTRGQGSVQLQTFVPQGTLYIQFDCAGPGTFDVDSTNRVIGSDLQQCSSTFGVSTIEVGGPKTYDDKPLTLKVTADPSMIWELYIAESRAPLPQFTVRADEQVLVPVIYGTGSTTLPTFSVGPGEWLDVQAACNSGSSADTLEMVGNMYTFGDDVQSQCSNPMGSGGGGFGSGPPGPGGSGPISVHVKADPSISWEILITAGPTFIGLSSSADVAAAPAAFGMGSATLATFTPTHTYSVAFVCSGVGALTIVSSSFTHVATRTCGGNSNSFTPPDQVTGQPVALSVDAPSSVGWEVYIYYVNASSAHICPAVWLPSGTKAQREAILAHGAAVCTDPVG